MNNKVRLMRHEPQSVTTLDPNRYEFNPKGRLPWLQRLLCKVLGWLRAHSHNTSITYRTVEIDTEDILTRLDEEFLGR